MRTRYYSPSLGRWLSRDPIGEKGGKNLYVFVMNNAIYLIDARGHSPKDVIKIYRVYRTTVNAMTSAEERNPNPVKNNEMRSIYDLNIYDSEGNRLGKNYQGCGEQAATVAYALINQTYDAKWTFSIGQTWYLVHVVGTAKSKNPCDPEITFDPWHDEIY